MADNLWAACMILFRRNNEDIQEYQKYSPAFAVGTYNPPLTILNCEFCLCCKERSFLL